MTRYTGRYDAPVGWRVGASAFEVFEVKTPSSLDFYWRPLYGEHGGNEDWHGPFESDHAAYTNAMGGHDVERKRRRKPV